jgi:hypothetical protein
MGPYLAEASVLDQIGGEWGVRLLILYFFSGLFWPILYTHLDLVLLTSLYSYVCVARKFCFPVIMLWDCRCIVETTTYWTDV